MHRTLIGIGLAATLALGGCASGGTPAAPLSAPSSAPAPPAAPDSPQDSPATPPPAPPSAPTSPQGSVPIPPDEKGGRGVNAAERSTPDIPADHGTALASLRLPREDERPTAEQGPWTPASFRLTCIEGSDGFELWALDKLEASRLRQRTVPEGADHDGLLQFATPAEASAFMSEAASAYSQCFTTGPESGNQGTPSDPVFERSRLASGSVDGPGEDAFTVRTWTERKLDDRWREAPGGSVTLWARKGNRVAFTSSSGEYVGDVAREAAKGTPTHRAVEELLG